MEFVTDIVKAAGMGAIIPAAFFSIFFLADDKLVSAEFRAALSDRLQAFALPADAGDRWPDKFLTLFDATFGTRFKSWKFFFRSCLASVLAVTAMAIIWEVVNPGGFSSLMKQAGAGVAITFILLVVVTAFLNFIPDYLSLIESRWLIAKIRGAGALKTGGLLVLDALTTAAIFTVFMLTLASVLDFIFLPQMAK